MTLYADENDPGVRGKLMSLKKRMVEMAEKNTMRRQEGTGYGAVLQSGHII